MDSLFHAVPFEFSDEDRWFRFFTKKMLAFIIPGLVLIVILYKFLSLFGKGMVGIVIGLLVTIVLGFISAVPKPENEYIKGGGLTLDIILLRRYIRKKKQCVYVLGYGH